jgi:hypothetical protein
MANKRWLIFLPALMTLLVYVLFSLQSKSYISVSRPSKNAHSSARPIRHTPNNASVLDYPDRLPRPSRKPGHILRSNKSQSNYTLSPSVDRRIYEIHVWDGIRQPPRSKSNNERHGKPRLKAQNTTCHHNDDAPLLSRDRQSDIARYCQEQHCPQWVVNEIAMAVNIQEVTDDGEVPLSARPTLLANYTSANSSRLSSTGNDQKEQRNSRENAYASVYNVTRCAFPLPPISDTHFNDRLTWQQVGRSGANADIHVSRAYFDRRFNNDVIRIIGVAFSRPSVNMSVKCVFWSSTERRRPILGGVTNTTISSCAIGLTEAEKFVVNAQTIIPDSDMYDQYIFSCHIVNRPRGFNVTFVSLTTDDTVAPAVALRIHNQPIAVREGGRMPDVAVCVPPLFGSPDADRLVEWLDILRKLAVKQIFVYGTFLQDNIVQLLKRYSGFVQYTDAQPCLTHEPEASVLLNESPAINDCLYRNMFRYYYLLTLDIDEIVVPRRHGNYTSLLNYLQREDAMYAAALRDRTSFVSVKRPHLNLYTSNMSPSYMVRNTYFFTGIAGEVDSGQLSFMPMASQHRRHAISSPGYSGKTFVNPQACIGLQNHVCWHYVASSRRIDRLRHVAPDLALLHHYKACHFDTYFNQPGLCAIIMKSYACDQTLQLF